MAGANWHFYAANLMIEQFKSELKSNENFHSILLHQDFFLAGIQGPDYSYYPGGHGQISKLAHGDQPADLGRNMLKIAQTEKERSFAYGWLMHLTTDVVTHPLVNQLIKDHFPKKTKNGSDSSLYPLGHHRVEWGIDIDLLQTPHILKYLPEADKTLIKATEVFPLVDKAYQETFSYSMNSSDWENSISGMIKYLKLFEKVWKATGRIRDRNGIKQSFKSVFYSSIFKPLAKLVALQNPENGAGVFIPIQPTASNKKAIIEHAFRSSELFAKLLPVNFSDLPNNTG